MNIGRSLWGPGLLLVALTASIPLSAAPPLDSAQGKPAAGRDTVIIGTVGEPDTLHPLFYDAGTAEAVLETLFTREVQVDNNWRPFPRVSSTSQTLRTAHGRWTARE